MNRKESREIITNIGGLEYDPYRDDQFPTVLVELDNDARRTFRARLVPTGDNQAWVLRVTKKGLMPTRLTVNSIYIPVSYNPSYINLN